MRKFFALFFLSSVAYAQTQPVGSGINMAKQSAAAPGPAGTDRVWPNSTGDVLEWTDASNITHTLATGGSVDGLQSPYLSASSAIKNIVTESTALGPIVFRDNATPTGTTLFGIQNSTGGTIYNDFRAAYSLFGVPVTGSTAASGVLNVEATTNATDGQINLKTSPAHNGIQIGYNVTYGTEILYVPGDVLSSFSAFISGDNGPRGGTPNTGTLDLFANNSATSSDFSLNDSGSDWANYEGVTLSFGLSGTVGQFVSVDFAPDTTAPGWIFNTSNAWTSTAVEMAWKNNNIQTAFVQADGTSSWHALLDATDLTFAKEVNHEVGVASSTTSNAPGGNVGMHSGRATAGNAAGGNFAIDAERGVGTGASGNIRLGMGDDSGGVQADQSYLGALTSLHLNISGVDVFTSNVSGTSAGTFIDAHGSDSISIGFHHGSDVEIYPPSRMRGETEVLAEFSVIGETHLDQSLFMNLTTTATDYTMVNTDLGIQFTVSNHTLTLLATSAAQNRDFFVQDASGTCSPSSPITIATTGGDLINGASSIKLTVPYSGVWLRSVANVNWYAWASNETTAGLQTTTGVVNVSSSTAPSTGYVLTATDSTHATWQPGGGGGGNSFTYTEQSTPSTPASGALTCWANGNGVASPAHTTSLYCMSHDAIPLAIYTSSAY